MKSQMRRRKWCHAPSVHYGHDVRVVPGLPVVLGYPAGTATESEQEEPPAQRGVSSTSHTDEAWGCGGDVLTWGPGKPFIPRSPGSPFSPWRPCRETWTGSEPCSSYTSLPDSFTPTQWRRLLVLHWLYVFIHICISYFYYLFFLIVIVSDFASFIALTCCNFNLFCLFGVLVFGSTGDCSFWKFSLLSFLLLLLFLPISR